ncbi:MAG: hypothetical protein C0425_03660 [Chlorobiaceae bacterium]|nr:hypothetical protein [Chlorobiaceae bacterium]MBA4309412.1 hypothetical protein [Chlorobiaceae bacterium]
MKFFFKSFLVLLIVFFNKSYAQDLQETLGKLSQDAASAYVSPIISGFGANLNSGWVHRPPKAKIFGIDIEFGVVAMGTLFGDGNKSFSSSGSFQFNRQQSGQLVDRTNPNFPAAVRTALIDSLVKRTFNVGIGGPTIVGSKTDSVRLNFTGTSITVGGQTYTINPNKVSLPVQGFLEDLSMLPLAAPQLSLGTVYGTSVSFRYLPNIEIDEELGDLKYFGFGVQHNPGIWLPIPLPVEITFGYFTQNMEVGEIFSTSATTFGLFASKTFGPGMLNVTPYAGFSFESSTIKVNYDYFVDVPVPGTKVPIAFELEGENTTKITVGASFKLAFLSLNVDYNLAKFNTLSAGVGIIF